MDNYNLFINGNWVEPVSDDYIEVENPATKEFIGKVPASKEEDVNKAVEGAKEALQTWKKLSLEERTKYVSSIIDYIKLRKDDIAETIHKELGAPIDFAKKNQVDLYLPHLDDYLRIAKEIEVIEKFDGYEIHKEPVGVVACLTPWNYPLGQIIKKIIPALIMGNTVVLKPSQHTPLTAYFIAQAASEVNLPGGVFQFVTGRGSEVGDILAKHKDVNMISFTGSTKGGIEISKLALDSVKRLALELGGKSPAVLLEGIDYRKAIKPVLNTVYFNTGQTCSAKTRLIAPRKDKDEIEEILVDLTKEYKFGDPKSQVDVGPLQSKKQFDKVSGLVEIGKTEGKLLYQGEAFSDEGYYFPPVIFTGVDQNAVIAQEEIFGPVLSVIYYDTVEEAIKIANNTIYGLSGMVFGPDKESAMAVAKEINTGQIQINGTPNTMNAPFGGFKQSGIGREGSIYAFDEYLEIKTIFV